MQPGKPQGFGLIGPDRTPLLALPGNPVSSYVSFELFVRPAIRTLMGRAPVHREVVRAVCADRRSTRLARRGKRQFLRGSYAPAPATGTVRPVGGAGSHLVRRWPTPTPDRRPGGRPPRSRRATRWTWSCWRLTG